MPKIPFSLVDAFTLTPGAGNPAGVIIHEGNIDPALMQRIAGKIDRESAFLCPADGLDADYRVAYYTGTARVPLCGHDTIAAIALLAQTGRFATNKTLRFQTDVGIIHGEWRADETAWMTQALPQFGAEATAEETALALGVDANDIWDRCKVVSTGTPFLLAPLREARMLSALAPDMAAVARLAQRLGAAGICVWAWASDANGKRAHVQARCFAPSVGLLEDPVTGSASGALGASLFYQGRGEKLRFFVEQGFAQGRQGTAFVEIDGTDGAITQVRVGGSAVVISQGQLEL